MASLRRLPPGFGFRPTDEELIQSHLRPKVEAAEGRRVDDDDDDDDDGLIAEVDILRYEPWDLPSQSSLEAGGKWYFFCTLKKKYLNGSRVNRATARGYWKSTGDDMLVCSSSSSRPIGFRKRLVFYRGRAPRGERTAWKMHEYRLEPAARPRGGALADYVLCRLSKENRPPAASEPPAAQRMDVLGLEEADLLPLDPAAPPLVPVVVPVSDVDLDTFWETIARQAVSAGGSAGGYVAEHGASHVVEHGTGYVAEHEECHVAEHEESHVAEHEESHVAEEVEWRTVYEELPPLSEGFSIDESHAALPAAPSAPATFAAPAPGACAPAALAGAARGVAERGAPRAAPVPPAPAAGATTITAALAGLAKARAAQGAAAPLGRTHARATGRPRSRPVRAAGAVMHGRCMQALNAPPQLAGGGGAARLVSSGAPSRNLGSPAAPHAQLPLAEAGGSVGDEDCVMGAQEVDDLDGHRARMTHHPAANAAVADGAFGGPATGPPGALCVVGQEERRVRILPVPQDVAVEAGAVEAGAVEASAVEAGAVEATAVEAGAVEAGVPIADGMSEPPLPVAPTRAAPSPRVAAGPRLAPSPIPAARVASAAAPAAAEVVLPPPVAAPAAAAEGGAGGATAGAVVVEEGGAVVEEGGVCAHACPIADLIAQCGRKTRAQRHLWPQFLPARRVNLGVASAAAVRTPAGAAAGAAAAAA
ncbi:unnamed protein product [Closterium sp. Naga37s-1]|nr:unnamed protein product [Closterium sp. Naga37s-1]